VPPTELPLPEIEEVDTPYKRRLALAVALLALFGGLVAFAASDAGVREAQTARDAQRASIAALSRQNGVATKVYEDFANYVDASTLKRQHDIAVVEAELLGRIERTDEAASWEEARKSVSDVSALLQDAEYADRPELLWNDLYVEPNLAALRQQAAQETANGWGDKANLYVGVITLLAVALTMLGLSLTVGPSVRRFLVWPAAALTAACLVGSVVVLVRPAPRTPEEAIKAVGEGDRLAGARDYEGAIAAYTRAIELNDRYAAAYRGRAFASFLAGSPERDSATFVVSTTTPEAYRATIEDLSRAVDVGGDDYMTYVNLGAQYFHVKDYDRTEEFSRRAIELNPALPLPWMNLGLALAGKGDEAEALDTYRRAIELVLDRSYIMERRELFASARGTLETLLVQQPQREELVRQIQALLVVEQSKMEIPDAIEGTGANVSDINMTSNGSALRAEVAYENFAAGSRISWIVYYRPEGLSEWLEPVLLSSFEKFQLTPSGTATKPMYVPNCPVSGEYRVDVYADGRRLASESVKQQVTGTKLITHYDAVGGIELCRPETWTFSGSVTGSADLTSPEKDASVSVRTLPVPSVIDSESDRQAMVTTVMNRLAGRLSSNPQTLSEVGEDFNGVIGTARYLRLSDTEDGYVWAGIADDGVLRTVVARYPTGGIAKVTEVALRLRFG
jgi:tetratricopeptide (TPR) repeat protein